jgi:hypothetical protein
VVEHEEHAFDGDDDQRGCVRVLRGDAADYDDDEHDNNDDGADDDDDGVVSVC